MGLALLLIAGGGVYLRTRKPADPGAATETLAPAPQAKTDATAKAAAELNEAPPPPPPDETEEAKPDPSAAEQAKAQGAKSGGGAGCSGACQGAETPALVSKIRATAGQARNCYNRALRLNAGLEGKMTASVRVGPSGTACQVNIVGDTLNDAGVRSCVTQMFRSTPYPAPQGGCVQIDVPLNFVAK